MLPGILIAFQKLELALYVTWLPYSSTASISIDVSQLLIIGGVFLTSSNIMLLVLPQFL